MISAKYQNYTLGIFSSCINMVIHDSLYLVSLMKSLLRAQYFPINTRSFIMNEQLELESYNKRNPSTSERQQTASVILSGVVFFQLSFFFLFFFFSYFFFLFFFLLHRWPLLAGIE